MAAVAIETPSWARLRDATDLQRTSLEKSLKFRDLRAEFEVRRLKRSEDRTRRWAGDEAFETQLEEAKARVKRTLLREDGTFPAGLARHVAENLGAEGPLDEVACPRPVKLGYRWKEDPPTPRPYQLEAVERLVAARHGAVELATGLGKTLVAALLVQRLGLPAVVASPFSTIVDQTHAALTALLGRERVGVYGNGKHDLRAPVTVCTAQALQRVKPGTPAWRFFQGKQVFIADESHLFAADTLSEVCYGVMEGAPYRFFLSGTQLRTDGLQLLLHGVTGDVLMRMSVADGVAGGYLAPPAFRMVQLNGGVVEQSRWDAQEATRHCVYRSPRVVATVADLINRMVAAGRPTLVLVDELDQLTRLLPHLRHVPRFAHGGLPSEPKAKKKAQDKLPREFWESDPLALVEEFNAGGFPLLVGTTCITTGADVRAAAAGVFWQAGQSETGVRQGVGRYLRLAPGKTDAVIFDVDVVDAPMCHRHALARADVYRSIYSDYQEISLLPPPPGAKGFA